MYEHTYKDTHCVCVCVRARAREHARMSAHARGCVFGNFEKKAARWEPDLGY